MLDAHLNIIDVGCIHTQGPMDPYTHAHTHAHTHTHTHTCESHTEYEMSHHHRQQVGWAVHAMHVVTR